MINLFLSIHWKNPLALYLLLLIPCGVVIYFFYKKVINKKEFLSKKMAQKHYQTEKKSMSFLRSILSIFSAIFTILAIARPCWSENYKQTNTQGRDLVFLLDVSKSMLAQDIKPNRLERAKFLINDVAKVNSGGRVALVLFAGNAIVACPLTADMNFFRTVLEASLPLSLNQGGSNFSNAIRFAAGSVFDNTNKLARDIIMITDGGNHDEKPTQFIKKLEEENIHLKIIGIGDPTKAHQLIDTVSYPQPRPIIYNNSIVMSKLEPEVLQELANSTPRGKYYQMGIDFLDLPTIYQNHLNKSKNILLEGQMKMNLKEEFQSFLLVAIIFAIIALLLPTKQKSLSITMFKTFVISLSLLSIENINANTIDIANHYYTQAQDSETKSPLATQSIELPLSNSKSNYKAAYNNNKLGIAALNQKDYKKAEQYFTQAYIADQEKFEHLFNLGLVAYAEEKYNNASFYFSMALSKKNKKEKENNEAMLNNAICLYKHCENYCKSLQVAGNKQYKEIKEFLSRNVSITETLLENKYNPNNKTAALREMYYTLLAKIEEQQDQQNQQAQKLKEELEKILKEQQEQKKQNEQKQKENSQQNNQQNQDGQQQAGASGQKGKNQQQSKDSLAAKQQELADRTNEAKGQTNQQEVIDALKEATESQKEATKKLDSSELKNAQKHQQQAEQELKKAIDHIEEELSQGKEGKEGKEGDNAGEGSENEQAELLRDETERRKQLNKIYYRKANNVEKDW